MEKVTKVYSGAPGCMCGCRGKWSYAPGVPHEDWQGKESPRSVKIITNKINRGNGAFCDIKSKCAVLETETRNLVAYYEKQ